MSAGSFVDTPRKSEYFKEETRDYTILNNSNISVDNLFPQIILPLEYEIEIEQKRKKEQETKSSKNKFNAYIHTVPFIKFVVSGFSDTVETQSFSILTKETFFSDYVTDEYTIEWSTVYVTAFNTESKCALVTISQTDTFGVRYALWMRKKNGRCHWIYIDKLKEYNKSFANMFENLEIKLKKYIFPQ